MHSTMKIISRPFDDLSDISRLQLYSLRSLRLQITNDLFVLLQYELLSTHYEKSNNDLNEPLRLLLIIYLFIRVAHFQNLPIIRCMTETLRENQVGLAYFQNTAPDLLFWVLFIGGMVSQGYRSHPWFVHHLADMAPLLGLVEWTGHVRPMLGEFFYTDKAGQTGAEDLWSEVRVLAGSHRHIAPKPRLLGFTMH
ncbi:hypothetical protein BJX63DRAFT_39051 [Aspergillus granulosus]|uniref:Uncharacterized protein n=1 Tax=Aspergillus granulosus TaxID=176169 RepID=A0ABR4H0A4_9EURO